jgi:hypothetical protein
VNVHILSYFKLVLVFGIVLTTGVLDTFAGGGLLTSQSLRESAGVGELACQLNDMQWSKIFDR